MTDKEKANTTTQKLWVFDPISVKHVDVSDSSVEFKIAFLDFLGIQRELTVSRSDCYFNFLEKVLKPMVALGYRYNTSIANAPNLIQTTICVFRPNPEAVKKALEQWKEQNQAQEAQVESSEAEN